jgi:uncharacterized protein
MDSAGVPNPVPTIPAIPAIPTVPLPWRAACERALGGFTRKDSLRFWGWGHDIEGAQAPPFDYRFEHTLAVVKLAGWLAPLVGADADVLTCAAWLHDCRKKLGGGGGEGNEGNEGGEGPDGHAAGAADALDGILEGTDFPRQKLEAVRHAILHHVGLSLDGPLEPLETACLWDIDKLSKLGAASLVHFIGIAPGFRPATTSLILEKGEKWLGLAKSIAESMNTVPARIEAARRYDFLREYYKRLAHEWRD